jgi:D-aminoacyl-tRNA deacylase
MRTVVQRVSEARVVVDEQIVGKIKKGLVVLLGIAPNDGASEVKWMTEKLCNLRIFNDNEGKMNLSLLDVDGEMLVISQFTLFGNCKKGRRPNFMAAAKPELAEPLFNSCVKAFRNKGIKVETGIFGANMQLSLCNDGPVTLIIESNAKQ